MLFTFPSRYLFTIGRVKCLALEGGPPGFPRGSSCPAVLGILPWLSSFSFTGFLPSVMRLSSQLQLKTLTPLAVPQPLQSENHRFRLFPLRSPLLRESRLISFPLGTKMFQFPRFPPYTYLFSVQCQRFALAGFPIRTSTGHRLLAAHRGFSQLTTSFIGFTHLGIHRMLFVF